MIACKNTGVELCSKVSRIHKCFKSFLLRMENSSKLRPMLSVVSFTFWTLYLACHDPQAVQSQPNLYDQSVEIRSDKLRVENRAMIQYSFLCKSVFAKLCSLVFVI